MCRNDRQRKIVACERHESPFSASAPMRHFSDSFDNESSLAVADALGKGTYTRYVACYGFQGYQEPDKPPSSLATFINAPARDHLPQ